MPATPLDRPIARRRFLWRCGLGTAGPLLSVGCSSSRPARRPNIVFLMTDDQRADALGCAGNPIVQTPNIDGLARQGMLFRNNFVTTSICAVSRASVFTGQYARSHGIPCGARGSGCSSVVSYCLGISDPDPLRYGLYFERFMDPDRDELPDIDVDICQVHRADVIDYVRQKYGHVAQIITFGTLKAKAAVKDVARVMGMGFAEANELTALIPAELKMTIDRAMEVEPELKNRCETTPRRVMRNSRC